MADKLNFTVLGSGNGGRAFCSHIAHKNFPVIMYEPLEETKDFLKLQDEKEIFLKGDIEIGGKLQDITMDMEKAVKNANVIIVVVPSFAHRPIFNKLIPELKDGQHVILVPGNYGGFLLKKMMSDMGISRDIIISELSSLPYACRINSYNTVMIYKKKFQMKLASSPANKNSEIVDIMNEVFNGYVKFIPGKNLLEMDLDNVNQALHPLPVLLNYGTIENHPETFRHYMDGVTPLISEKMERLDQERLNIGKAFSLNLMPTLDQLKMYYGSNNSKSFYEYVNSDESPYKDIVGHDVMGRYLTEDIPFLHVPACELAAVLDLKITITNLCVQLASELHNTDYISKGYTLDKLGIANKQPEEIMKLIS
ncbi:MAG: NAD/NADP octopine/nopaline dehydrogenase family protein [Deltaproteobacteria bacterium]|jgi:opine dehydrogenase|nr:NAD/NADP octopine/nopaline dehydrogenase family protein [Deltaproteobacteria bacterium]